MQIFEAVFSRQLGPTRPVAPLTEQERVRLRELVQTHAPRLRKLQFSSLEDKLQVVLLNSDTRQLSDLLSMYNPALCAPHLTCAQPKHNRSHCHRKCG